MTEFEYSRRDFIKKNSLLGLGAVLAPSGLKAFVRHLDEQEKDNLMFFDAFTRIDPRRGKHPEERWSLDHLLKEMKQCSISGALVASTMSGLYDPMYANLNLSERLKKYPNLFAMWNVMPHQTDEFPNPARLGELMKQQNVRAVSIHPKLNAWDWRADTSKELLTWLSRNKVLTMVTVGEIGGWSDLNMFLKMFPELPVFLVNATWSEQRYLLPLLHTHKNLHIGFDNFQINEGLEYLHEKGFTDRLLYGSMAPAMSAGAHRSYVSYAGIPLEAKQKIAGGNLTRLLKGQKPASTYVNPDEDIIMRAARLGQPLPVPVIDMHMHMLDKGLEGAGAHYRMHHGGPEGVFELVTRIGYKGGGIMSWNGVVSGDSASGNVTTSRALDVAPKGFWGLATFDTTHYTQAQLREMIPKVYEDPRFIGMKPYLVYGKQYHDPSYDIWWEFGNRHKFYALLHNSASDLREVLALAPKYPDVRWVIAHAGGSFNMADMAIAAMKKYPNIYAEITLTPVHLGIVEYLVAGAGENRIMYGSDLPMRDPRQQMGWVVFSDLPVRIKKKILAENAIEVIRPCLDRLPEHSRPSII